MSVSLPPRIVPAPPSSDRAAPPEPAAEAVRLALDAVSDGIVIASDDGTLRYRNAAAARLLDDGGLELARAIEAAAADALSGGAAGVRDTDAGGRRFELRAASFVGPDGLPGALVVITRMSLPVPSADAIARRHGLSSREAAVAHLLAKGRSNDAIVQALGISASTARHYTERILVKLGTRSRGAVAAIILGATAER